MRQRKHAGRSPLHWDQRLYQHCTKANGGALTFDFLFLHAVQATKTLALM